MRIELVANLIEAMDFTQFREFARQCIQQRGYQTAPSDGWSDGGRDIRVYTIEGKVARQIAFQTSVEWEWKAKLWEDLVKAKEKLGSDDFIYVTNRRIADAEFEPLRQKALTDESVHLGKMDKQDLAAHVVDTDRLGWFSKFVGLPHPSMSSTEASLRSEVADAFVLFSDDAEDFRDRIVEHALMVALLRLGQMKRKKLVESTSKILDYSDNSRIEASIDRLQQSGEIKNNNGVFELSKEAADGYEATETLVAADRERYQSALRECIREYISNNDKAEAALGRIEELLGTIVRRYADYQVSLLKESTDANDIRQDYAAQVRELETAVHEVGIPHDQVREFIDKVNAIAQEHPVVTRLAAGDVFRRLLPSDRSALLNALGRVKGVQVFLEPTVVIPLLCSKLYRSAAGSRKMRAAQWLFDRAAALRVRFYVPDIYVEECAVHLVSAGQYVNVFHRIDPRELAYSENAFVGYYAALSGQGAAVPQYKNFLELFGFSATGDWATRVEHVQAKLRQLLRTYSIKVENVRTYKAAGPVQKGAEKDLGYIYNEHQVDKPDVLVRHDIQMLAYARDKANRGHDAIIVATWDSTLQAACRVDAYNWWCIDPLHAGDLMALVEPGRRGVMGVDVALLLDDVHLKQASRLWDTIVRIEKDNMFDAQLIDQAIRFRKQFMSRQDSDSAGAKAIAKAWKEFQQESSSEPEADSVARTPK